MQVLQFKTIDLKYVIRITVMFEDNGNAKQIENPFRRNHNPLSLGWAYGTPPFPEVPVLE